MWAKATGILAVTLTTGGCFDFTADGNFNRDGTAQVDVELAVSSKLAAFAGGLGANKSNDKDILSSCREALVTERAPAGIRVVKVDKSARGEMLTCSARFMIQEPVKASTNWKPDAAKNDGIRLSSFTLQQLNSKAYRLTATIESTARGTLENKEPNPFLPAFLAAMDGHYISIAITADRIENTTGQLSNNDHTVMWKLPVTVLINPSVGFKQEVRADIIYDNQSWLDRLLSSVGLGGSETKPAATDTSPKPSPDRKDEQKAQLAAELLTGQAQLRDAKASLIDAQSEAEAARRSLDEIQEQLDNIVVSKSRFSFQPQRFGSDEAVISFTLENRGAVALKQIFIEGTLQTPGRAVPWVKDTFSHDIKGGVEPKEQREFNLAPNMFGEWAKVPKEVVGSAVLSLKVVAFEDPTGKKIGVQNSEAANKQKQAEQRKAELEQRVCDLEGRIDILTKQLQ